MYDINATRLPVFFDGPSSGVQLNDMIVFDMAYVLSTELLDMLTDDFVRLAWSSRRDGPPVIRGILVKDHTVNSELTK